MAFNKYNENYGIILVFLVQHKKSGSNPNFGKAKMYRFSSSLKLIVNFLSCNFLLLCITTHNHNETT